MVDLRRILTSSQKQTLLHAIQLAEEAKAIAAAAMRCEIDCGDWQSVAATIQRKARLMHEQFGDPDQV